uniref:Uncharacterized protein n=1 Tax=Spumella elongata TaxID=89044 RepID=A0A7S3M572_9STRA|mmetsp:Transcript_28859/g.49560  ORF Transcript_28859/g.49560 Transcript_28859/m.49560 type:complete len:325 (+) Transcript_28859:45-1019(+)|eukprot:CAMPEP_0184971808 /NCGR_PEP_ID=MMETSP1098-20130426/3973_1 /TAXON_ID=89044 /ORGANISM="Spumella elongata, Strain CCAP 955/1" /LENGTH=324 /DNA_ID=CAMNT_0027494001 /DNA_START=32 /DNA_END=1006 /DNA_ORIENTATION=+
MGKKDGNRKRKADEVVSDNEEEDAELQAELAAVLAARQEKKNVENGEAVERVTMYNKEGMLKCVEELDTGLPFAETLVVCEFHANIINENDDIEREMAFYNQTMSAVTSGRAKMAAAGLPVRRPNDYFCENLKTDAHMTKIKDRLLIEDKRIEAFELRKNKDNNRKFNKQVKELRKQEGAQSRKEHISDVTKIRKDDTTDSAHKEERIKNIIDGQAVKSKKRINMDKKYGFGGAERKKAKLGDKKSLNDLSEFNPRGGKFVRREGGGGRGGGRGGAGRGGGGRGAGGRGGRGAGGASKSSSGGASKPFRAGKDARAKRRSDRSA